jgi:DNA-binding HxlR family transcriptional regulator
MARDALAMNANPCIAPPKAKIAAAAANRGLDSITSGPREILRIYIEHGLLCQVTHLVYCLHIGYSMRSYKQRCGLAKALEIVGDRWTLLIIRELMIRESCRYTDIRNGLPGIASNLLAERLQELEAAGILFREEAPPPIATTLYRLTDRGRALESSLLQLGAWGAPLLTPRVKGENLQAHWLVLPLRLYLKDRSPDKPRMGIDVRAGDESIAIVVSGGRVDVRLGHAETPAAVVSGRPDTVLQLFTGRIGLPDALSAGLLWEGPRAALDRVVARVAA